MPGIASSLLLLVLILQYTISPRKHPTYLLLTGDLFGEGEMREPEDRRATERACRFDRQFEIFRAPCDVHRSPKFGDYVDHRRMFGFRSLS